MGSLAAVKGRRTGKAGGAGAAGQAGGGAAGVLEAAGGAGGSGAHSNDCKGQDDQESRRVRFGKDWRQQRSKQVGERQFREFVDNRFRQSTLRQLEHASSSGGITTSASTGATTTASKPVIRSFTYAVVQYVPLRPVTTKAVDTTAQKKAIRAKAVEVVVAAVVAAAEVVVAAVAAAAAAGVAVAACSRWTSLQARPRSSISFRKGAKSRLVSCFASLIRRAYEDEEKAQLIRYLQAKSYVEQADAILEVTKISLREYRDGIYPQDRSARQTVYRGLRARS